MRRIAFDHLNRFIEEAKQWPLETRKGFVDWLCCCLAAFSESDGYGLSPHPLVTEVIEPTLAEWMTHEVHDSTPCRWAGMFFSGVAYGALRAGLGNSTNAAEEHLREAIRRNSGDRAARVRLIELIIGDIEFNGHHLPEYYLGDPNDDLAKLSEGRELLASLAMQAEHERLRGEIEHVAMLVSDWVRFRSENEKDFKQWCSAHGREYKWCRAYYYSKRQDLKE